MHPVDWQISADGYVTGADVHDGRMIEFSYKEGTFKVGIARFGGGVSEFQFSGVAKLHADLLEDQIVYAVFAWKFDQVPDFSPEAEDNPWRLLAWPSPDQDLGALASRLAAEVPEGFLVQISCTYGGDVALTCKEIEVFDRA